MLPARKPFHASVYAAGIVSRFPSWMKIQDPSSNGFKFIDALIGNEIELFATTFKAYQNYFFIDKASIDAITSVYQLELPFVLKDIIINTNSIPIKIVENSLEFVTNPPTRLSKLPTVIIPSGLNSSNIVGLEWLTDFNTGSLVVKTDQSDITPSSLLYYNINSLTNEIDLIPTSGTTLGLEYVGLNQNGLYELASPESEWSLRKKYPLDSWLSYSNNGDVIQSTTMPSGITWQNQSYFDPIEGTKIYYKQALNNPYGSGVYNQADITLTNIPLSGTVKVYDDFNLTSGVPTLIPSSGLNIYGFVSGVWEYRGYENPIPWDVVPTDIALAVNYIPIVPTLIGNTSWRILPVSGYIDNEVYPNKGTFKWIDGSGLSNTIRFSGGISKYEIHYAYSTFNNITQLSASPKQSSDYTSPLDSIVHFIDGSEYTESLNYNMSRSSFNAIRIEPTELRPGSIIYYTLLMNTKLNDTWNNAQTIDKTVQFYNHNMGYTDELGIING